MLTSHADEAAFLWVLRDAAVGAPHYKLEHLARLDNRVEAHIDGLRVAGEAGWELALEQLGYEEAGEVFAAGVLALESRDPARIDRVLEVAERVPETARGFVSALGWVEQAHLQGTVREFSEIRVALPAPARHRRLRRSSRRSGTRRWTRRSPIRSRRCAPAR